MKQGQRITSIEIHSEQIEKGVNGCVHLLERTMSLTPAQAVFVLQEAARFIAQQNGISPVFTQATHVDTGAPLVAKREGCEL